jgi:hypothetical protein
MGETKSYQARISADLSREVNVLAIRHGLTLSEITEMALMAWVASNKEAGNGGGEPRQGPKKAAR